MNTLTKLSYQGYIFAMLFITSRAPLSPLALAFCAALVTTTGCPKPSAIKVPPPPPGDMLRYLAKANDKLTGKVNVRFEDGDLGVKKPTVYAFMFKEERQVQSVDGTGNMNYTASFFDVEPVGDTPKDKKAGEQLARALQTVKIAYTMSPRGDVTNFDVKVPDDIKESKEGKQMERQLGYVRLIAQWVYGADRGPQFDPGHIEAGKGWPIRASIPTPTGGSKNWDMTCTYAKREQGIAYINMEGKVSGENQGTKTRDIENEQATFDLGAQEKAMARLRQQMRDKARGGGKSGGKPLLGPMGWGGAVAAVLGLGGLGAGGAFLGLAASNAQLVSGDSACETKVKVNGVAQCPHFGPNDDPTLSRTLKPATSDYEAKGLMYDKVGIAMTTVGGVLLAGGGALLTYDLIKRYGKEKPAAPKTRKVKKVIEVEEPATSWFVAPVVSPGSVGVVSLFNY